MAEAIFNHFANKEGAPARAVSAGTIPATEVDPQVADILSRHAVEYTKQVPKKLTDEMLSEADYIVSFGCLIPDMFPRDKFEEWLVDDPQTPEEYEHTFRSIQQRVAALHEILRKKK